jgi:hypothetical protein
MAGQTILTSAAYVGAAVFARCDLDLHEVLPMNLTDRSIVQGDTCESAQLIGVLQIGSLVSGECSLCNEVILSKVSAKEASASRIIKEAFAKHVRKEHFVHDTVRLSGQRIHFKRFILEHATICNECMSRRSLEFAEFVTRLLVRTPSHTRRARLNQPV